MSHHSPQIPPRRRTPAAVVAGVTLVTALTSAALGVPGSASGADGATGSRYTFSAGSYGTQVTSRLAGLRSGPTSASGIGCTKLVPLTSANSASTARQNPQVRTGHVETRNSTFRDASDTGARSVSVIDSVVLDGNDIAVSLTGLRGRSTTYGTNTGTFEAGSTLTFTALDATGAGADLLPAELRRLLDGPVNGVLAQLRAHQPIEIPGLGVLRLGDGTERITGSSAEATQAGLQVELYGLDGVRGGADDSVVTLAHTSSRTSSASPNGILQGSAFGLDATAADGSSVVGKQVLASLPCEGTDGSIRTTSAAQLDQPKLNGMSVGGLQDRVYGAQTTGGVTGWTESSIASLDLGDDLHVRGISARSTVTRTATGALQRRATHRIASITSHGRTYAVPAPGESVVVPGVARIDVPRTVSTPTGVRVTGLRITLLSGSAAQTVVNLAVTGAAVPE